MTTEQAVVKLKISMRPPTGAEKYQYLQQKWKQQQMSSFIFFPDGITKTCCSHLGGNAKNDGFLPRNRFGYVKAGLLINKPCQYLCTESYRYNFLPLHGGRKRPVGRSSRRCYWWSFYRFTRKAVFDETFFRKSINMCKSTVGIDASQFYPYSMSQSLLVFIHVGIPIQKQVTLHLDKNKTHSFKNKIMSYF